MFLAPQPGAISMFEGDGGLKKEIRGLRLDANGLHLEEKTCCFSYDQEALKNWSTPPPDYALYQYRLSTDENTLYRVDRDGKTILLDFIRDSWSIPLTKWGIDAHKYPDVATCRIVSKRKDRLFGETRFIVDVHCEAQSEECESIVFSWSFASGLGFIAINDFMLRQVNVKPVYRKN